MTTYPSSSPQNGAAAASCGHAHLHGLARRHRASALALGLLASCAALAETAPSTLPSVQVQEQRRVTGDYAGGQVAAGGRVGLLGDKDFMDTPFNTVSYTESFIRDRQAKDLTDVIAATDPTVFSNGVTGAWSENYAIRGFASSTSDTTFNGLIGMAPYYRTSPEMFERIEVLKGPSALLNGMPPGGSVGGSVNLVPKRAGEQPLQRVSANFASDAQFGTHVDIGRRLGTDKQFGIRFNGAYRDGDGAVGKQRKKVQLGSLALDWRGERARLSADLYSADDRVDGPARGVGLAPGVAIPRPPRGDTLINPDWAYVDSQDKGAMLRGELDISDTLMAYLAYGTSRTDYRYNGSISAQTLNPAGDFTTVIGQLAFDIRKQSADAGLRGSFHTGSVGHQLTIGADYFRRTVDRRPSVNEYVGTTNIHDAPVPVFAPSPKMPGPSARRLDSRQTAFFVLDRISFGDDWQWLAGGRFVRLDERAYDKRGTPQRHSRLSRFLPQTAVVWKATDQLNAYASYVRGISLGQEAPFWTSNADTFLPSVQSRQLEVGLKYVPVEALTLGAAVFRISQPYQYAKPDSSDVGYTFVEEGTQTHTGLELTANGQLTDALQIVASASVLQARARDTGTPAYEGHQLVNVPKVRASVHVAYALPFVQGLDVTGGWRYAGANVARADGAVRAPDYSVFDAGLRFQHRLHERAVTWNLSVDNVFNRFYWRDTGSSGGDYYLFPGAPRQARLSVTFAL
ncbi:TonB-dependent siderophore receptor [Stenotrophomonas maltophilia]|nr:TonB-dependent siderophore receptor [Stenotrophomonas maltophilia]